MIDSPSRFENLEYVGSERIARNESVLRRRSCLQFFLSLGSELDMRGNRFTIFREFRSVGKIWTNCYGTIYRDRKNHLRLSSLDYPPNFTFPKVLWQSQRRNEKHFDRDSKENTKEELFEALQKEKLQACFVALPVGEKSQLGFFDFFRHYGVCVSVGHRRSGGWDSTLAVNIIDISSRETSPWIPMPALSPAFSLGGSIDFSLEIIGQSFDPYYEYHYSPMPMESSPTNPGTEARDVDMEVQQ
ncbi:hypothetical protein YC2023_117108 [Brassica napus]